MTLEEVSRYLEEVIERTYDETGKHPQDLIGMMGAVDEASNRITVMTSALVTINGRNHPDLEQIIAEALP